MEYYCDDSCCLFYHSGWCSYYDSSTKLMNIRGLPCKMNSDVNSRIVTIMEDVMDR